MKTFILTLLALSALTLRANSSSHPSNFFPENFSDSTLRLDYVFTRPEANAASIALRGQTKTEKWFGRRGNLDSLALAGNGRITVTSLEGDTIYRDSFSSLFLEWIETGDSVSRTFEHVALIPAPLRESIISVELSDARHNIIGRHTFRHTPGDILIRRPVIPVRDTLTLHSGNHTGSKISVSILSEGYTQAERDSFFVHARTAVENILAHEPFTEMAYRFDFTGVFIPSGDSGVSVPRLGQWKNTPFRSHYSTFYSDRYLTCPDVFNLHDQIDGLPAHHIIILANSDEYGGGGIYNSYTLTTARHKMFRPVVVHEFGHSFGGLADEYYYDNDVMTDTYPLDVEPWERNITTLIDFNGKWENLTKTDSGDDSEIGLFEGGGYSAHGIFRPAKDCRMKTNTAGAFCRGCQQALRRLIIFLTD